MPCDEVFIKEVYVNDVDAVEGEGDAPVPDRVL